MQMGNCNTCKDDRPDILRSNISICGDDCNDCTDQCNISPKQCDCPVGHIGGGCVHYNGCKTFISQISPGMTFDQVVCNIEKVFDLIDRKFEEYCDRISDLETRVEELENKDRHGEGCDEWEGSQQV